MFIQNKYTKWYFNIINRHLEDPVDGYTERHHIIPKGLGGSDKGSNLVSLSAKAHYICHLLLIRMCFRGKDKAKMVFAIKAMSMNNQHQFRYTSRIFHIFREAHFSEMNGENHPRYGTKLTDEHKQLLSEKAKGQWATTNPPDQTTRMVIKEELQDYLNCGWVKGRKYSNPFVGSGTNFR